VGEWFDNQKQSSGNFYKLLQEQIEKANPRRKLSAEETKRLNKLEGIAEKLKQGDNVQNRQLKTWLSDDEYEQKNVYGLCTFFVLQCVTRDCVNY